jgi:hypothetical protein
MTVSTSFNTPAPSLRDITNSVAPKGGLKDLFGLLSGLRAYRVYTALESRSDPELRAMGLTRKDLPRVALEAMLPAEKTR